MNNRQKILGALVVIIVMSLGYVIGRENNETDADINVSPNTNVVSETPYQEHWAKTQLAAFNDLSSTCLSIVPETKLEDNVQGRAATVKKAVEILSTEWKFMWICKDTLNKSLFHILTLRYPSKESVGQNLISVTKAAFPRQSGRYLDGELSEYGLYEFASHLTVVNQGKEKLRIEADKPHLIRRWAWGSALAGCTLESGDYSRTGKINVSCGGGDNGCFVSEFVRFGIVNSSIDKGEVCSGNCDLSETEPAKIECS